MHRQWLYECMGMCRLVDMDLLTDMLANMFKSDARTFHRRLGVLRCFRPDNPTGTHTTTNTPPSQSNFFIQCVQSQAAQIETNAADCTSSCQCSQ